MEDLNTLAIAGINFPPVDHIDFAGQTYKNLSAECVYVWMRGSECLYVGHSSDGFRRLRNKHHVINTKERVQDEDKFQIFLGEGRELETALIKQLKPKYNKVKNRDSLTRMYDSPLYSYLPAHLRKPLDQLTKDEYQERLEIRRRYRRGELPCQAAARAEMLKAQIKQ